MRDSMAVGKQGARRRKATQGLPATSCVVNTGCSEHDVAVIARLTYMQEFRDRGSRT